MSILLLDATIMIYYHK